MFPGSVAREIGLAWAVINNKNVIVEPGVYHVLWIGGMFLWGDKLKKLIIGRARCIPCSRDRWYVPLVRLIKYYHYFLQIQ